MRAKIHRRVHGGSDTGLECVAVGAEGRKAVTGGFSNTISMWDIAALADAPAATEATPSKSKRLKSDAGLAIPAIDTPVSTLTGHTQVVTALSWDLAGQVVSGSHDQSVRV
eukprot:GFYU01018339.1.p1 GENE.GFYU01018339.1~~GFYU01018339.1.p1  ORF type:complete len:111 (+),score=31.31 GFYU01018339.1:2-334(+)